MNGWAILFIVLMAMRVTVACVNDGESRPDYSFGITLIRTLIDASILYMAGLFG